MSGYNENEQQAQTENPAYKFSRHAIRSNYMDKSIEAKKKVYLDRLWPVDNKTKWNSMFYSGDPDAFCDNCGVFRVLGSHTHIEHSKY